MEISAMKTNFLALALSLCLLLSSFHEVSCQDDGSGLSNFDLIERDYQDSVNALQGKEDEDQSAKIQSENKNNTTVTDKNTISLSLSDETEVGSVSDESVKRSSLLDQIELEFEAHHNSLNQAGSDGVKAESKDDEELSAQRQKMLEEIEREFEAASSSLKQLKTDEINEGNDEEHSAKRQSLLDEIEREFEAATKELEQLKVNDFTIDKDDEEQSAKRKSMLEAIEREFEAAMEGIEELKVSDSTGSGDDEEQSAQRKSMLEEIEREFEAAIGGLKQIKVDDSRNIEEESAKRKIMLEEMEREFEEAHSGINGKADTEESAKKQSDYATPEVLGLGKPGVCSCFNQDNADLKHDDDASIVIPTKYSIEEILSEESAVQGTETSSLTASLTQLVENHRKEKESPLGHRVLTSSSSSSASSTSESSATSETVETLRAKLKELRGLTARELVTRQDFDQILITAASFEELSSAPISYISRLAKYRNVIKEGLEASERVHIAQARATMLKEVATEKQTAVDSHFATAKTLAQKGDALFVRIFAIKKLLAKLEAEKESIDGKFKETVKELSHFLVDASDAYEEYHGAVRKAKDEQAAEEFAKEATQSAEIIWVKFLSSL
ncbi:TSK-associating protein 1 isoform X4 [Arabidopsis lyrata subsp. lyrata]|uniref:TSK-associating protein 1 isoform X4 n=1 Tax=Arabidopsis lyrata subsp. lyrata TaxID=81972 RepID=UPI000A29B9C1|nr:TSK-associating protein 1 isoform X4 [Arabidopsis lyrata subsp. lyrata]|eukprot:XP_020867899.1 TSK-associating protein 1 isoform X4 [Arabidopsis lyrata subsp. lyrata]